MSRCGCVPKPWPAATRSSLITRSARKPMCSRVVVVGERERVVGIEPAVVGVAPVGGFADGHHGYDSSCSAKIWSSSSHLGIGNRLILIHLMIDGRARPDHARPAPHARRGRRRGQLLGRGAQARSRPVRGQHRDGEPRGPARRRGVGPHASRRDADPRGRGRARRGAARARRGRRAAPARGGHGARRRGVGLAVRRRDLPDRRARSRWRGVRARVPGGRLARRCPDARRRWRRASSRAARRSASRPRSRPHRASSAARSRRSGWCRSSRHASAREAARRDRARSVRATRADRARRARRRAACRIRPCCRRGRGGSTISRPSTRCCAPASAGGICPSTSCAAISSASGWSSSGRRRGRATSTCCGSP